MSTPCRPWMDLPRVLIVALLATATGGAAAEEPEDAEAITRASSGISFEVLAGVWLPRVSGNAGIGATPENERIDLRSDLDVSDIEVVPSVELTARFGGEWDAVVSGFDFSFDSDTTIPAATRFGDLALAPGDAVSSAFEMTSFAVDVNWALIRPYVNGWGGPPDPKHFHADGTPIADLRFGPQLGVRYIDLEQSVRLRGGAARSAGDEWIAIYGGAFADLTLRPTNGRVPFMHALRMGVAAGAGPTVESLDDLLIQVRGTITWFVTPEIGASLGYRLLNLDLASDAYEYNGEIQGLFAALSIQF